MPATAAATVVAAPIRGTGRLQKGVPTGRARTCEAEARRAGRALLRSALLLFPLMVIPSPIRSVSDRSAVPIERAAVLRGFTPGLSPRTPASDLLLDVSYHVNVMRMINHNNSCCVSATC